MRLSNQKLFSIVMIANVLFSAAAGFGQRPRGGKPTAVAVKSEKKPLCSGGWSGIVSFSKTLKDSLESDEPGIRKDIDRIKHKTSRDYDYNARTIVDSSDPKVPAVTSKVSFQDNDLSWGQEKVFDTCNSRESGHWFIIEGTDDRQTQAQAAGPARSFNLNVDEMAGTYSFNLSLPDAKGTFKREEHTKRSGHCQPKNNLPYDRSTDEPFSIKGEGFSVYGEKIDPNAPDQISGSKVWGDDGKGAVRSFVYQVTWRFTRCPQKLLITELKFQDPKFPNYEDWRAIDELDNTVDGNRVKIKAKVLNMSAESKYADLRVVETYKGDKWNGARPDEPIADAESSFRIDAGEEKEFEFIWDSEGQAWFNDGRPHLLHRLKAVLSENNEKRDERTERLNIAPKPLVLLHGIWSDYRVWQPLYQNLLTLSHSYHWKAYLVGEKAHYGAMSMGRLGDPGWYSYSVYDNADQVAKYVRYAQEDSNAWHVDMVAHSTGGLVARLYLHKLMPNVPDARPQVKHLMMLGTPNGGVPCVDVFLGKLDLFKQELKAARELTNDEMLRFNQYVTNTGGTKVSALAGNPVPVICGGFEWNDGFVTVRSATYGVADTSQANDLNLQLTDERSFGNFVLPHILTGPDGKYPRPVKSDPTDWRRWQVESASNSGGWYAPDHSIDKTYAALFGDMATSRPRGGPNPSDTATAAAKGQTFAKQIKLAPKASVEIEMPVAAAPNLGVTFIAHPGVSVSLLDAQGVTVSRNPANSELANRMFRNVLTPRPVGDSVWKLRIENSTDLEVVFAGFSWSMDALPSGPAAAAKK